MHLGEELLCALLWCIWQYFDSNSCAIVESSLVHDSKTTSTQYCWEVMSGLDNLLKRERMGDIGSFNHSGVAQICMWRVLSISVATRNNHTYVCIMAASNGRNERKL